MENVKCQTGLDDVSKNVFEGRLVNPTLIYDLFIALNASGLKDG